MFRNTDIDVFKIVGMCVLDVYEVSAVDHDIYLIFYDIKTF